MLNLKRSALAPVLSLAAALLATLALSAPAANAAPWTGYVATITPEKLIPFNTDTGVTGTPIEFRNSPRDVVIAPDGKTAYVAAINPTRVIPVDLPSGEERAPFPMPNPANSLALTPDGSALWVASTNEGLIRKVDLATGTVEAPIEIGAQAWGLAINPDGASALVATGSYPTFPASYAGVAKVDLATGSVIQVGDTDSAMQDVAVLPDGSSAYAIGSGRNRAYQVQGDSIVKDFSAGPQASEIAIAPDGSLALVVNFTSNQVTVLDLVTNTTGITIPVGAYPRDVTITPDSRKAFVTNRNSRDITPIDLETLTPGTPIFVGDVSSIAITPNQPPVASFAVGGAEPGKAVNFDAAASTDTDGQIASYAWDFGDGTTETGTTATTTHTYAAEGTYTARLSLVDDLGCSTETVFTGQMASCGGSTKSTAEREVIVKKPTPPPPPTFCELNPNAPRCVNGGGGGTNRASLSKLKVAPKTRALKRGRKVVFTVSLRNTGKVAASNLRICANAPKRLIRTRKCVVRKRLAPGKTAKAKFVVRAGKKARAGRKATIRFRATAKGVAAKRGVGVVRFR